MDTTLRVVEASLARYRRSWRGTVATSAISPILYLAALGVGLGTYVNRTGNPPGGGNYLDFVAPGLLAATAMQIASIESSYPIWAGIKWWGTYPSMLATPLRIRDIVLGHQVFVALRLLLSGTIYLIVIAAFGAIHSAWAILALPCAVLVGLAFSAPIAAFAANVDRDNAFAALFRFVIVPMFLFSATFYPLSRLPEPLVWIGHIVPLWQGVELCRDLTLGTVNTDDIVHVAYLTALMVAGVIAALYTHRRRLLR
jgi:lipooligosaccharide transport system permease protein